MKPLLLLLILVGVCSPTTITKAQLIPVAIPPGVAKFIGATNEFSATAEYRTETLGHKTNEQGSVEPSIFFSKGNFRTDVDMAEYRNVQYPASEETKENWRKYGMAEAVAIYNLASGEVWDIRPKQRGAFGRTLTKDEVEQVKTWPVPTEIVMGKETIEGHLCTKSRVTFQKEDKEPRVSFWELYEWSVEGFVWRADDMNGFPVQVVWKGQYYKASLRFKEIKIGNQDATLFTLPSGYTKPNRFQFPGWPGQREVFSSSGEKTSR